MWCALRVASRHLSFQRAVTPESTLHEKVVAVHLVESPDGEIGAGALLLLLARTSLSAPAAPPAAALPVRPASGVDTDFCRLAGRWVLSDACEGWEDSWLPWLGPLLAAHTLLSLSCKLGIHASSLLMHEIRGTLLHACKPSRMLFE